MTLTVFVRISTQQCDIDLLSEREGNRSLEPTSCRWTSAIVVGGAHIEIICWSEPGDPGQTSPVILGRRSRLSWANNPNNDNKNKLDSKWQCIG